MTYTAPHSLEAETSVLGAALLSERAADEACDLLTPDDFYRSAHGLIFATIAALRRDGIRADSTTVTDRLSRQDRIDEVGGPAGVADVMVSTPSPSAVGHYAALVADHARRRQVIDAAQTLSRDIAGTEDVEATVEAHMEAITTRRGRGATVDNDQVAADFIASLAEGETNPSWQSGWNLDRLWKLPKGALTVVTGLPSSGKSTWLDVLLWRLIARHSLNVAYFSPEQGPADDHLHELVHTWLGTDPKAPGVAGKVDEAMRFWLDHVTWIDDARDSTPSAVLATARRETPDVLVVDTWKDLHPDGGQRDLRQDLYIQDMLRRFRRFARDTACAVVIVAHPRQTETVAGTDAVFKVPTAAHISGGQEWWNSADTILCVWRNQSGEDPGEFGQPEDVKVVVQKVRRKAWGRQGAHVLRFDEHARRYEDARSPM